MTGRSESESLTLTGEPASAGAARRFLRRALGSWGAEAFEDTATLLLTELVANAVLHAKTDIRVQVVLLDHALRLEVADGSARMPHARQFARDATTGRGLKLVASMSSAWGAEPRDGGKVVWCEIPDPGQRRGGLGQEQIPVDLDTFPDLLDGSDSQAQSSIARSSCATRCRFEQAA